MRISLLLDYIYKYETVKDDIDITYIELIADNISIAYSNLNFNNHFSEIFSIK